MPADAPHARQPELTLRAILTGMAIGAVLTPCNVYSGLKIGWAFNMSVAAGLVAYALWNVAGRAAGGRCIGLLENNINQTSASSAASIVSSGLAAPIPALTLLTGQELAWQALAIWLFVVSLLGVVVAAGLRNQMLMRENLSFPSGVVTAEAMQEIHAGGREAMQRLRVMIYAGAVAAGLKFINDFIAAIPKLAPPINIPFARVAEGARQGEGVSCSNLGLALDPSLLMVGFGAIAGLRVGLSVLLGAAVAWAVLAPVALSQGWASAGESADAPWFGSLVEWLLWPGATLMTVSALISVGISVVRMRLRRAKEQQPAMTIAEQGRIMPRAVVAGFLVVLLLSVSAQTQYFAITILEAIAAILLSYVLAVVAARVSGETGITPIGALGKVTQFTFALISPGNIAANLMSANVTGGAAGQAADMLHDLRTGQIIGATPGFQVIAQVFGVLTGSLAGAAAYLLLIPDPQAQLLTPEWPAPAVATWKAVAEVLMGGLSALPPGAPAAMALAALAAVALALAERFLPPFVAKWVPSAPAMGLAFVIPAWNSISLFLGAVAGALLLRLFSDLARRRIIVIAAGLVVGESLMGVVSALSTIAD
ncbi:OPT/YSL family transporter [Dichotomicrobium thermohalophilum]|uniref:Putative OPT family oligopeptide transporter n=1 Tax=Dichotomicrobium thermohalophilum TaxID=933063 RepID=A0A397PGX7_9HYPH|nr:OPT family oligopeptide transporter [Dichotomicrobium thermohalophilum]RIA47743.1 putative OPT family oligopeptide transporter [Dichotomicrobium thermohalophilum]